jgi:hypothetical protein
MEPIELQRLVDGELDTHERRRLLQRCDEEPQQWRTLALCLLEEQAFGKEVALFVNDTVENRLTDSDIPVVPANNLAASKSHSDHAWGQLALAAALFIAVGFFTGYGLRSQNLGTTGQAASLANGKGTELSTGSTNVVAIAPNENHQESLGSAALADRPREVGELRFVSDHVSDQLNSNPPNQFGVPIYEVRADHIQQMMEQQFRQINEWNQQNMKRGVQIDWQPEMLESQLPDGRAVVVPINQWNVRPLGQ